MILNLSTTKKYIVKGIYKLKLIICSPSCCSKPMFFSFSRTNKELQRLRKLKMYAHYSSEAMFEKFKSLLIIIFSAVVLICVIKKRAY